MAVFFAVLLLIVLFVGCAFIDWSIVIGRHSIPVLGMECHDLPDQSDMQHVFSIRTSSEGLFSLLFICLLS